LQPSMPATAVLSETEYVRRRSTLIKRMNCLNPPIRNHEGAPIITCCVAQEKCQCIL